MKMKGLRRTAAAAAAVALSVGVIAGCGSSSTSSADSVASEVESVATTATTAAALTQAEYATEANAICAKIEATSESIDNEDSASLAQAEAQLDKAIANAKEGVAELKALVPPADLQAAHDTLVRTSDESIVLFQKISASLDSGDLDDATLAADGKKALALAKEQFAAAKELGLSNCFDANVSTDDTTDDNDTNDGND